MARCGTDWAYSKGCRCEECRNARAAARRAQRALERGELPAEPLADRRARRAVRFSINLTNLRHGMTLEDWQAREAADPNCRPVTQGPMHLHAERTETETITSPIDEFMNQMEGKS